VVSLDTSALRLAQIMARGSDVWLSTPRRPMEASGTSGMKAAMNGVLHVSVLDGWWPEACEHGKNGWQIGDGSEGPGQDERDHAALFEVLEKEVLPAYADEARWLQMMRSSIETVQWRFSSHRMVEDFYVRVYRQTALLPVPVAGAGSSPSPPPSSPAPAGESPARGS